MAAKSEHVDITAQCLCKAHSFTTSVERSKLPLQVWYCHCDSCRHSTGALYSSDVAWPGPGEEIQRSSLKRYVFTPRVHILFCGTCSSPMFFEEYDGPGTDPTGWGVFTGVLSNNAEPGLATIASHIFVGDTLDGGATMWLRSNGDGTPIKRWTAARDKSEEVAADWPPSVSLPGTDLKSEPAPVPIRCRCKGVDLVLRWDEIVAEFSVKPKSELPWFIDPETYKLLASFDVCDSCRLSCGVDVLHWTFTMLRHISFPGDAQSDDQPAFPHSTGDLRAAVSRQEGRDPRLGTLAFYASSDDVQRYFCSNCSATVFYAVDVRTDMVDLAAGLLESPAGARAEDVLSWNFGGESSWRQDVEGGWREGLVASIEKQAEEWRVKRQYPKNWRRIIKEKVPKEEAQKAAQAWVSRK